MAERIFKRGVVSVQYLEYSAAVAAFLQDKEPKHGKIPVLDVTVHLSMFEKSGWRVRTSVENRLEFGTTGTARKSKKTIHFQRERDGVEVCIVPLGDMLCYVHWKREFHGMTGIFDPYIWLASAEKLPDETAGTELLGVLGITRKVITLPEPVVKIEIPKCLRDRRGYMTHVLCFESELTAAVHILFGRLLDAIRETRGGE